MVYSPQFTNIKQSLIRSQANLGPVLVDFRGTPRAPSPAIGHLAIFLVSLVQLCSHAGGLQRSLGANGDATSRFEAPLAPGTSQPFEDFDEEKHGPWALGPGPWAAREPTPWRLLCLDP